MQAWQVLDWQAHLDNTVVTCSCNDFSLTTAPSSLRNSIFFFQADSLHENTENLL